MEAHVNKLIERAAAETRTADDAMKFSQAALNAANAIRALADAKILGKQL